MSNLFFPNADYYKNEEFQRLMREWNNLDTYKDCNPEIYEEIVGNLMNEFYRISKEWLKHNYDSDEWKESIE
jgi:hypothetical protein